MKKIVKKERKPKVTIDDLALMVQGGFSELHTEMDKRFEAVDKRFDEVDHRLDGLEQRMGGLERRMDVFADHERRLTKVERQLQLRAV